MNYISAQVASALLLLLATVLTPPTAVIAAAEAAAAAGVNRPAYTLSPADDPIVETYWVLGDLYRFLAGGPAQGLRNTSTVEVLSFPFPPEVEARPPFHVHSREDEEFYVLSGEMTFKTLDKQGAVVTRAYGPGSYLWQPRGTAHTFWPTSPGPARFLVTLSSPELLTLFRAIGTREDMPLSKVPERPVLPTPEQLQYFGAHLGDFGVSVVQPAAADTRVHRDL